MTDLRLLLLIAHLLFLPSLYLEAAEQPPFIGKQLTSHPINPKTPGSQNRVSYDKNGFMIDGKYRILRGGSLQWFRIPEIEWEDRIKKFKAAGFNTIDMYVPWNLIEPVEGLFNFKKPNIERFLKLAKKNGLWIYIRPGPYITNEMDGGGFPAWLFKRSSKRSTERDGLVNLRTSDPDFLAAVKNYFRELNRVIAPHQISKGGSIILYSIENEYDWFDGFFQIDKVFIHKGHHERHFKQKKGSHDYFTALKDYVQEQGIDVPITSCPGNAEVAHMGDVADIIPMPNIYNPPDAILNSLGNYTGPLMPEKIAMDIVTSMHDPDQFEGLYNDMPTGTSETYRSSSTMNRLVLGGMKAFFGFNMFGFYTPGYFNSLTFSNRKSDHIRFKLDNLSSLFVKPSVGYFHNVIDFYGVVGPSGTPREKFYNFRRANLFLENFEHDLASLGLPYGSSSGGSSSDFVNVKNPLVGAQEHRYRNRQVYWHQLAPTRYLIGLVNETIEDIVLPPDSITIGNMSLPRYRDFTLSREEYPGSPEDQAELEKTQMMMINTPLSKEMLLQYTTSEILSQKMLGGLSVNILYGLKNTSGELVIKKTADVTLEYIDPLIQLENQSADEIAFSYDHSDDQMIALSAKNGKNVYFLITSREKAGRTWSIPRPGDDSFLLSGPDLVLSGPQKGMSTMSIEASRHHKTILTLGRQSPDITGYSKHLELDVFGLKKTLYRPRLENLEKITTPAAMKAKVRDRYTISESLGCQNQVYQKISGSTVQALEHLGIHKGTAWYRNRFTLSGDQIDVFKDDEDFGIHFEHAADIVSIYLNGHYISTLNPVGNSLHTKDLGFNDEIRNMLRTGENTILVKTEIWGHGSFMWPRGRLRFTNFSIPSLGYDSLKGLWGFSKIGGIELVNWEISQQRCGEILGFKNPRKFDRWDEAKIPLTLNPGESRWWSQQISRSDFTYLNDLDAPQVLKLKGTNLKASIYLDGKLIGRWISDDQWLQRGTWLNSIRNPWMELSPDHFPMPLKSIFNRRQSITLSIIFEDTSSLGEPPGQLDALSIELNEENKTYQSEETKFQGKIYKRYQL